MERITIKYFLQVKLYKYSIKTIHRFFLFLTILLACIENERFTLDLRFFSLI